MAAAGSIHESSASSPQERTLRTHAAILALTLLLVGGPAAGEEQEESSDYPSWSWSGSLTTLALLAGASR